MRVYSQSGAISRWMAVAAFCSTLCLAACGGGGGSSSSSNTPPPQPVAISAVTPGTASVALGATQQFSATVTGSSNTSITWQVNGTAGGAAATGTISASGLYTAPNALPSPAQVTVTAVAQADTTQTSKATVTVTSSVAVSPVTPANPTVAAGTTQQFSASTTGDPGKLGVTWSVNGVSGGNAQTGTITAGGLYTAPSFPPAGGGVTIAAASVADGSKSASTTAAISIANASLSGSYAFSFTGTDASGVESAAGSFVADGKGNLASGLEDINSASGVQTNLAFTGTYSVGADGRGTAKITDSAGAFTFAFVLQSSMHALLTEFDGTATVAGAIDQQDATAFTASALQGNYVFGFTGRDSSGIPIDLAGLIATDGAGAIKSGVEDINDGGAVSPGQTFTGSYTVGANGRGTASFVNGAGTTNYACYVVSAAQLDCVQTNTGEGVGGAAYRQTTSTFSNATLTGNYFFYFASHVLAGKVGTGNGVPAIVDGVMAADGAGNIKSGTVDEIAGSEGFVANAMTGQYSIAANGRGTGTLTYIGPGSVTVNISVTFYMISQTRAVILSTFPTNSPVLLGTVTAQQGSAFSNSSFNGRYAFSLQGAQYNLGGALTDVGQVVADGNGNLTATEDINVAGALSANVASTGTYSVTSTSRGKASLGASSFVIYVVSPSQVFFVDDSGTGIREGFATLQY